MIKFKKIKWKNFLSTGNQFTELSLDRSPTTLVVGENGSGKSTMLDAICFALFGKPFRNINKGQLLNTINQKQAVVEIEFSIGKKEYRIVRGIKPNTFEIFLNDELINQDAAARDYQQYLEEHVLKLNFKSFTQIVILGSASFTPFMQLPSSHRREIIEDILDIQIFSVMNDMLKAHINETKDEIRTLEGNIEVAKQKVKVQDDYVKTLEQDKLKKVEELEQQITTTESEIEKYNLENAKLQGNIEVLESEIKDSESVLKKRHQMSELQRKLSDKIMKSKKEMDFYHNYDTCPTCSQGLSHDFKSAAIDTHTAKVTEINTAIDQMVAQIEEIDKRIDEIEAVEADIAKINSEIIKVNNSIIAGQRYIQKVQKDLDLLKQDGANIAEEKEALKNLAKQVLELQKNKANRTEDRHYQDICASLLKDSGIKTKIIRQYLPVINKLVNKYLVAMDFFVSFELDESFSETIKSRHRDAFSYASFSEGEKQKIDLALLFTWRSIARMKNSAATNLLILDEVFDSSLDGVAVDYVMNILGQFGDDTNIFVISHRGDQLFDKFRSVIKFEKQQNFSRIV